MLADGIRDRFLRGLVLFGAAVVFLTELLGAFGWIRRGPLAACWIAVGLAALFWIARQKPVPRNRPVSFDPLVLVCMAGIAAVLVLTAITAAFSPPNSSDAMAYHMPRVVYWAEQGSVRFFPTPYLNQIMLQPAAEYLMLHTYVLSGGDQFVNFVQWLASLASAVGVSAVAGRMGASPRGQAVAALFCAALPSGILASSGAKNDYWLAMWLVAAVYFSLRVCETQLLSDALFLGAATGLALLTKATAYLFVPWPLAAIFVARKTEVRMPVLAIAGVVALTVNAPLYVRNYDLSHSVLGFDSAQGNGVFRWRNETFGWKETASNMFRNISEQLGDRSDQWNHRVYAAVAAMHQRLGIDLNDPRTTWKWATFEPPRSARNHEADANCRWQLAILLMLTCVLGWRAVRFGEHERFLYALALFCGFVAFCAYLKWQPYLPRLFLPLFVLGAPLAAFFAPRRWALQLAVSLFLLNNAKPALFENWVRPLKGPRSVLQVPRDLQYFADMTQWNVDASYLKTVDVLAGLRCEAIGIDMTDLELEYPLQALLRERKPQSVFLHTGVQNVSIRYRQPVDREPCAVACLNCAGDDKRLELYSGFPVRVPVDRFVVFVREPSP